MKKIQTILCWLIGHKFVWKALSKFHAESGMTWYGPYPIREDYCVRCGLKYEDLIKPNEPNK